MAAKFTPEQVQARVEAGANNVHRAYQIFRSYHPRLGRRNRIIDAGPLTEAEAQAHCHRADTRKPGEWFDGYQTVRK